MNTVRDNVLLLGCGSRRDRVLKTPKHQINDFLDCDLVTVDFEATHNPDIVMDLNDENWPFHEGQFDEIHAYEVLEHLGQQGDFRSFFRTFSNIWYALKPGGFLCASVPSVTSPWAWGDPGHTRLIQPETLTFLMQSEYEKQIGMTAMSDYREYWKGDFVPRHLSYSEDGHTFFFILEAIK